MMGRWITCTGLMAAGVCLALTGCGGASGDQPPQGKIPGSISFGIFGGNMVPWMVDVRANGEVVRTQGSSTKTTHVKGLDGSLMRGLFKLARADHFFSMSSKPGVGLPDAGQLYIRIGSKRVYEQGSKHVDRFDMLLRILETVSNQKAG